MFTILPVSSVHFRIIYRSLQCIDIQCVNGMEVSIRDGAYSVFDTSRVIEGLTPISGLQVCLCLSVSVCLCAFFSTVLCLCFQCLSLSSAVWLIVCLPLCLSFCLYLYSCHSLSLSIYLCVLPTYLALHCS